MTVKQDNIVRFAKQRGFIYPSSAIYDGISGVYDYGPQGVLLANNLKERWLSSYIRRRDIVPLDSSILMNPSVWKASGHTKHFSDPVIECNGVRYRVDHLLHDCGVSAEGKSIKELEELLHKHKKDLPKEIQLDACSPVENQSLLVPAEIAGERIYLRGETAAGIYTNFKHVLESSRQKIPFGIAQIGKAFRNEISPRRFLFRQREFTQMEMQYFVHPTTAKEYFKEFLQLRYQWLVDIGIKKENLRFKEHERPVFYAKQAVDIEYKFPFGWGELEGIHNRGEHDLTAHTTSSSVPLDYFDQEKNERFTPFVIETSIGLDRLIMALLTDAYTVEKIDEEERIVLKFDKKIAPTQVAVLPLSKKEGIEKMARTLYDELSEFFQLSYDDTQSIGKRYRRQDELGTPVCITVDFDSLNDSQVTVRDRDSMKQLRIPVNDTVNHLHHIFSLR